MKPGRFSINTNKIAAIVCSVFALPGVVWSQDNPSPATGKAIAGDWIIHFQADGQSVSGKLHFEVEGSHLTGTIETAHTGQGTIADGKWDGHRVAATLAFERHDTIALEGELKADGTLAGEYRTEGRKDTWQAERAPPTAVDAR